MKRQYTLEFPNHCGFNNVVVKEESHKPFIIQGIYERNNINYDGFIIDIDERYLSQCRSIKLSDKHWLFAIMDEYGISCHYIRNPFKPTNVPAHHQFTIPAVFAKAPYTLNVVIYVFLMLHGFRVVNKGTQHAIIRGLEEYTALPRRAYHFNEFYIFYIQKLKKIKIVTQFGTYIGDPNGITANVYKRLTN